MSVVSVIILTKNRCELLKKALLSVELQKNVETEIIVVNDGSTDNTISEIKRAEGKMKKSILIDNKKNLGKGAAVRSGIQVASGDYIVIQDADLEYHPADILQLLKPVLAGKTKVVYGTRLKRLPNFHRDERTIHFFIHFVGNKILSLLTSILYGQWITDMETGYKLFAKTAIEGLNFTSRGFEFEPEITAKLLKKGYKIVEIPISTNPRGYEEGKKLNTVRDGLKALWTLIKYRFI
jgi:glycosyltransferase involved in cell wall biosynthesis